MKSILLYEHTISESERKINESRKGSAKIHCVEVGAIGVGEVIGRVWEMIHVGGKCIEETRGKRKEG